MRNVRFKAENIGIGLYRPFCKEWVYYDRLFNHRYKEPFFPTVHHNNLAISVAGIGVSKEFSCLIVNDLPDVQLFANGQCFPLYYYEPLAHHDRTLQQAMAFMDEGAPPHSHWVRHDAITDWALQECRMRYGPSVIKEDIFYYVYGLLHSPDYRTRFAADLKKMLPRVPFVASKEDFWAFSKAGRELAHWHLDYETVEPWCLCLT